ncbi:MAG: type 4a pilus biogenesis protein PilO [Candidatus Omnitrophica bacterium]|nr:type 4a pilus biogenesis protein PilO [Candidatus Omnitrophota bacterium]MBU1933104.1 type 4a pilus biogenesis protein PilO [Candidatus Omnitrophota bacterium]
MNNFKIKEIILATGISIIAISMTYYLLYVPKARQIAGLQKETKSFHEDIEEMEKMICRVPNPKKEIEVLGERLQKLKEKATDKEQTPRIIQQLFQKTGELNIEVISINPREETGESSIDIPEGVGKIYVEIKIRCSYKTLLAYIEALNHLPLLFTLEDLSIEKAGKEASENVEVLLLLSAYVMA